MSEVAARSAPIVLVGRFAPLARRGLVTHLEEDQGTRVTSVPGGASLRDAVAREVPSAVFLDTDDERSTSADLRARWPALGIAVLADDPERLYGMLLLAAGITYVPWSASADDIVRAVTLTAHGGCMFVSSEGHAIERANWRRTAFLTLRERQVLAGLSSGQSPTEIAADLAISVETARRHIAHLRRKLEARRRNELVGVRLPRVLRLV